MSEVRFDASKLSPRALRRQSPWWGVHAARYAFASQHVLGACVLDIACGTGYGLPVLQARARFVVGVDIDLAAAVKANEAIRKKKDAVVVADGCLLPFADLSFDVITSFETLEHLETRSQFLAELRRVLKPAGLCIVSTPNANHTRPVNGKPRNPHHVFEYNPYELVAELQNHFKAIELLGQVMDSRFVISPFIDDQERMPRTSRAQVRLFLWRVINKMPVAVRDRMSQAIWGHPLFPSENDYNFTNSDVGAAPVLVALCRKQASL
jgi:SAM-dependent methyltransferase